MFFHARALLSLYSKLFNIVLDRKKYVSFSIIVVSSRHGAVAAQKT